MTYIVDRQLKDDFEKLKDYSNHPEFLGVFSISRIQRFFKYSYCHAACLVDYSVDQGLLHRNHEEPHLLKFKH